MRTELILIYSQFFNSNTLPQVRVSVTGPVVWGELKSPATQSDQIILKFYSKHLNLLLFTFVWPCIVTNFFIIKPTRCNNFLNFFWHETLRVADSICICSCSTAVYTPVWHIPVLSVQWKTPDDGQRNCPQHVESRARKNLRNYCI